MHAFVVRREASKKPAIAAAGMHRHVRVTCMWLVIMFGDPSGKVLITMFCMFVCSVGSMAEKRDPAKSRLAMSLTAQHDVTAVRYPRRTACQPLQRCEQRTSCLVNLIASLHSSALHRLHACRRSLYDSVRSHDEQFNAYPVVGLTLSTWLWKECRCL